MKNKKTNKVEYNKRLLEVSKRIGEGAYRHQIVDEFMAKYDLSKQMVDKMIGDVYDIVRNDESVITENIITKYNELYIQAIDKHNYKLAKEINDSLAKITILKQQKLDITSGGEPIQYLINIVKDSEEN